MTENIQTELKTMMKAADMRSRPVLEYSRMTPEEFVPMWLYGRFVETFSVALVELGTNRKWPTGCEWQKIFELSGSLTDEVLFGLAEKYYEAGLFWVLSERMCEQTFVMEEFAERIKHKEIGTNLILMPVALKTDIDLSRIERLLEIDRLEPFLERDRAEEAGDLKARGRLSVLEAVEAERGMTAVPIPAFPLQLHPDIQKVWGTWMTDAWKRGMESAFGQIKAGLTLSDEALQQKTRDHMRNYWATRDRRYTSERFQGEDINSETLGKISTPEDSLREREKGAEAYDYVVTQWKEKGRIYLDTLIATEGNVTAASEAAGVSRVTGHMWRKEIRNSVFKKKPTK